MKRTQLKADMAQAKLMGSIAFAEGKPRNWFSCDETVEKMLSKYTFPSSERNKILKECLGGWDCANFSSIF